MYRYRLSKYDPTFRNAGGAYLKTDWTSFSDVGRSFEGTTLTRAEYQRWEDAYVEVIGIFLADVRVETLEVTALEILEPEALSGHASEEYAGLVPKGWRVELGSVVGAVEVARLARLNLREALWCKLEGADSYLHFGYDFYVYLGAPVDSPAARKRAQELGLFVESFPSPYED